MGDGLSRRDLIKGAAVAGAAAWTAPIVYSSMASPASAQTGTCVCSGVKIPSCSAVNVGKVALCTGFETGDKADFTSCVSPNCNVYSPAAGFLLLLCGAAATSLSGIAVKISGNAPANCVPINSAQCFQLAAGTPEGSTCPGTFGSGQVTGVPYSCDGGTTTVNGITLGALGGSVTTQGGTTFTACNNTQRYLYINVDANVNEIGLQICSVTGSLPPTCASNSCTCGT